MSTDDKKRGAAIKAYEESIRIADYVINSCVIEAIKEKKWGRN